MENKTDNNPDKKEPEQKKSWIERNLWLIAVAFALFFLRMCNELSR